jgi:RNA polymerase sigma factor (sigma-70 family)
MAASPKKAEANAAGKRRTPTKKARERLVIQNAHLARVYATKFGRGVVPFEDLVQEAWVGLLMAAERFDPSIGVKFDTFARYHARRRIAEIQDRDRPTAVAGDPEFRLRVLPDSREEPPAEDEAPSESGGTQLVRDAMEALSFNERRVLRLREGIGYPRMTIVETARFTGLAKSSVSRIYDRAKRRLREAIEARQNAA